MDHIVLKQLSSLEKVFPDRTPHAAEFNSVTALKGERLSYQIAFEKETPPESASLLTIRCGFSIEVKSPLKKYIELRVVGNIPSEMPAFMNNGGHDDNFLSLKPGLFPDPLYPMEGNRLYSCMNIWHSLWIMINLDKNIKAGTYPVDLVFKIDDPQWVDGLEIRFENEQMTITKRFTVTVIDAELPKSDMIFSQWFHADCIYSYYNVPCFSRKHWSLMEKFIKMAADYGINTLLTPIFTPPLDTNVGKERPTVQLVDIKYENGKYSFEYEKFDRFVSICRKYGIEHFEMAHLFTQWGATATPKIIATVDGKKKRIFGWDIPSDSKEYFEFLDSFLPSLVAHMRELGIADGAIFHLSDEPSREHIEHYSKLKKFVEKYLDGFTITDALSHYEFYEQGIVEHPVVGLNHIDPFIEHGVKGFLAYYCCGQCVDVSNRMFAMPSARNRSIAEPLFKYDVPGFMQWGYNFYYSKGSEFLINPFVTTDALFSFPSGDSFSVYPGRNGPIESLRLVVFAEALNDLRAMRLLESYIGHDAVVEIIENTAKMKINFKEYPHSASYILKLREKINKRIAAEVIKCQNQ